MKFLRDSSVENQVFQPHWPEGLQPNVNYKLSLEEFGDDERSLSVVINDDGDVYVTMAERQTGKPPEARPSICARSIFGGGRHLRTKQALLWLAEAIKLDNNELGT